MDRRSQRRSGETTADSGRRDGAKVIFVLCAVDAAIQVLALVAPHPSQGTRIVTFALLPAILGYHALLVAGAGHRFRPRGGEVRRWDGTARP